MCHLSRLLGLFVSFWILGAAPGALAQEPPVENARPDDDLPPLTELKIVRSSRTDVPDTITVETAEIPAQLPRLYDQLGVMRLMRNEGVTLQWISWEERGDAWVAVADTGHWLLMAGQYGGEHYSGDRGTLDIEGFITEIGKDYFVFSGTIKMRGAPDDDRFCRETKQWRFEVTQNRSYYRLREFEWCDGLTDYVDVYFDPALR